MGSNPIAKRLLNTALAIAMFFLNIPAFAQPAPVNLDLSSTARTVQSAPGAGGTGTINVGGNSRVVSSIDALTSAELMALMQVVQTGQQAIQLGMNGNAIGGQFSLNSVSAAIANLVIPSGVTALRDFGTGGSLTVAGNITNAGNLFALSTNSAVTNAIINANDIFNQTGAILSTMVPANLTAGLSTVANLNLTLNAANQIVNEGQISSAGSLSLSAGSIINRGLLQSLSANVNFNVQQQSPQSLTILNSGVIEALNGSINVREESFTGKYDTKLLGGDWLAKQLNSYSGDGKLQINVNQISAEINAAAGESTVWVQTGDLRIGSMETRGDPIVFNADGSIDSGAQSVTAQPLALVARNGSVNITGDLVTNGGDITIAASQSVIAGGSGSSYKIDSSSTVRNGGKITILAGSHIDCDNCSSPTTFTVSNIVSDESGGSILFDGSQKISLITSAASGTGFSGGAINMAAYKGTASDSGVIQLPASSTINSSGRSSSGDVKVYAGGTPANGESIVVGNVRTTDFSSTGQVDLRTVQPNASSLTINVSNGSTTAVTIQPSTNGYANSSIHAGDITALGVNIRSGANFVVGNFDATTNIKAGLNAAGTSSSNSGDIEFRGTTYNFRNQSLIYAGTDSGISIKNTAGNLTVAGRINVLEAEHGTLLETAEGGTLNFNGDFFSLGAITLKTTNLVMGSAAILANNQDGSITVQALGSTGNLTISGGSSSSKFFSYQPVVFTTSAPAQSIVWHSDSLIQAPAIFSTTRFVVEARVTDNGNSNAGGADLLITSDAFNTDLVVTANLAGNTNIVTAGTVRFAAPSSITFDSSFSNVAISANVIINAADLINNANIGGSGNLMIETSTINGTGSINATSLIINSPADFASSQELKANTITFDVAGSIGSASQAVPTRGATMQATAGGAAYIQNTRDLLLLQSTAGAEFKLTNSGNITLRGINNSTGMISVLSGTGNITLSDVTPGVPDSETIIRADNGSIVLNSLNNAATITVGNGASILASEGSITIANGTPPSTASNTPVPANVTITRSFSGIIDFGVGSISAEAPTNSVYATGGGALVLFSRGQGSIVLKGSTTIGSGISFSPLTSLDLMDQQSVSIIQEAQLHGILQGTLIINNGVATGGNLIVSPGNLSSVLSAVQVPQNVTLTLLDFDLNSPLTVSINESSTSLSVSINGLTMFSSSSNSPTNVGVLHISTDQPLPALLVGLSGNLTGSGVNGSLQIDVSGAITNHGSISANTLTVHTNGGNDIIGSNTGQYLGRTVNLMSTGSIGTSTQRVRTSTIALTATAGANVFLTNFAPAGLTISTGSATGVFDLISSNNIAATAAITANSVVLSSLQGQIGSRTSPLQLVANVFAGSALFDVTIFNSGDLSLSNLNVGGRLTVSADGSVAAQGLIQATAGIAINVAGTGSITNGGGSFESNGLTLTMGSGNVGSSNSPVKTTLANLDVFGSPSSSVFVENSSTLVLGTIFAGAALSILARGDIQVTKPIPSNVVSLTTEFAGTGDIILKASVGVKTGITTLMAGGSGSVKLFGGTLTGDTLSVRTTSALGSSLHPIRSAASNLAIDASTAPVFISNTGTISIGEIQASSFQLISSGSIVLDGNINSSGSVSLKSAGGITQSSANNFVKGTTISFSSVSTMGLEGTPIRTMTPQLVLSATGSGAGAFFENDQLLTLNASTVQGKLSITTPGGLKIGGPVKADSVELTVLGSDAKLETIRGSSLTARSIALSNVGGNIGSASIPFKTATSNLTLNTNSELANLANMGSLTLSGSMGSDVFRLTNSAGIILTSDVGNSGSSVSLTAGGAGSISAADQSVRIAGSTLTLQVSSGSIGTTGAPIHVDTSTLTLSSTASSKINLFNENTSALTVRNRAANTFNLSTQGSIDGAASRLVGGSVSLNSIGDIGDAINPLFVTAGSLALSANKAWIVDTMPVKLGNIAVTDSFTLQAPTITQGSPQSLIMSKTVSFTAINIGSTTLPVKLASENVVFNVGGSAFVTDSVGTTVSGMVGGTLQFTDSVSIGSPVGLPLSAGTLALVSGPGGIGEIANPLLISATNLRATTPGDIFIDAGTALLKVSGPVTGNNVALSAGSISRVGTAPITGSGITLLSRAGDLGSSTAALILMNAPGNNAPINLTAASWNTNVFLDARSSVKFANANRGTVFTLTSTGDISFSPQSQISSSNITLSSVGSIGQDDLVVAALNAPRISLKSGATGIGASSSYLLTDNTIFGAKINATIDSSGSSFLRNVNPDMSLELTGLSRGGGSQGFNIDSLGALTFAPGASISSKSSVSLSSNKSMTTGVITTTAPSTSNIGNIFLSAGDGTLTIGGNIKANGGSILVQHRDADAGVIAVNAGVRLTTMVAATTDATNGIVALYVGDFPTNPTTGTKPANLNVITSGGAQVFFGESPSNIVVAPPAGASAATANAKGRNVILNAGSGAGQITLAQKVLLKADPPLPIAVPPQTSTFIPLASHNKIAAARGEFDIRNAASVVTQTKNVTAVYNLQDTGLDSIKYTIEGKIFSIQPGFALIVAENASTFQSANPTPSISYRGVHKVLTVGNHSVFLAEFSIPSLLSSNANLGSILSAAYATDKKLYRSLLKTAAIIQTLRVSHGMYKLSSGK